MSLVQSSGKIDILAEVSPSSSPTPMGDQFVVVQLNSNGSIDTTFGTGGIADQHLQSHDALAGLGRLAGAGHRA